MHPIRRGGPAVTEQELAAAVVRWLEQERYEVAQEVEVPGFGILDIVARMGRKLWVIEAKLSLSLDLVAQVQRRVGLAHRVSVVVPHPRRDSAWTRYQDRCDLLRRLGIGVITAREMKVHPSMKRADELRIEVREHSQGVYQRPRLLEQLAQALRDEHFSGEWAAAGAPSAAGRYTAFAATAKAVQDFVAANPGCSIAEIIEGGHHYSSDKVARARLDVMIRQGVIPGIRRRGSGQQRRYYPEEPLCP